MFCMYVTDDTSHLDRSPSNVRAPPNMIFMLVTREVSHLLISWLNDWAFWNNEVMLVTNSVFQSGMSEHPALAQRGGAKGWSSGLAQWRSVEQHFSPEGTAARRVHRSLERGPGRERGGARRPRKHPVAARGPALDVIAIVAHRRARFTAREGVGAVADAAVEGRGGRVARVVFANPRGGWTVDGAAR